MAQMFWSTITQDKSNGNITEKSTPFTPMRSIDDVERMRKTKMTSAHNARKEENLDNYSRLLLTI